MKADRNRRRTARNAAAKPRSGREPLATRRNRQPRSKVPTFIRDPEEVATELERHGHWEW